MAHTFGNNGVKIHNTCLILSQHSKPCSVPPSHDTELTTHQEKSKALVGIGVRWEEGPKAGSQDMKRTKNLTKCNTHSKTKGFSKLRQNPNNKTLTPTFTHLISSLSVLHYPIGRMILNLGQTYTRKVIIVE